MSWLPIESAPKDGTKVLLYCPHIGVVRGSWQFNKYAKKPRPYWSNDWEAVAGAIATRADQPTHWMPLPPPPQDETDDRWELTEAGRAMRGGK